MRLNPLLAAAFATPLAAFALATAVAAQIKPSSADKGVEPITVTARAIESFSKTSSARRFGKLEFRGGLVLSSSDASFGGWSGLVLDEKGSSLIAVSDAGAWMTGEIVYDAQRRPTGIAKARLGPLKALSSKSLRKNRDRDAEAISLESGTVNSGVVLIAFEGNHRVGRFRIDGKGLSAPLQYLAMPSEFKGARKRDGLEALTTLRHGRNRGAMVAIAESYKNEAGDHTGWIWPSPGSRPKRFHLSDPGGFNITDIAETPDGDLVVLERRFRWLEGVKMRLRRIAAEEMRAGARIEGEVLFEADMSYEIDNMEGLAVHRNERGETVLTVMSDDNFNGFLQRTLLLQFVLEARPAGQVRASR